MNFLSSRSLSPHNAFGARLTLHNYPPGGHTSGASEMPPADRRTKLRRVAETLSKVGVTRFFAGDYSNTKAGDVVRVCYNFPLRSGGEKRGLLGVVRWIVREVMPGGFIEISAHHPLSHQLMVTQVRSWVRVR